MKPPFENGEIVIKAVFVKGVVNKLPVGTITHVTNNHVDWPTSPCPNREPIGPHFSIQVSGLSRVTCACAYRKLDPATDLPQSIETKKRVTP